MLSWIGTADIDPLTNELGYGEGCPAADLEEGRRKLLLSDAGFSATAALAFNDLVATGLIRAFSDAGVSVPADVSVVGFDDIPFARYLNPTLDDRIGPDH